MLHTALISAAIVAAAGFLVGWRMLDSVASGVILACILGAIMYGVTRRPR